jgi:tetraacyldisaccharide 4'-kinase
MGWQRRRARLLKTPWGRLLLWTLSLGYGAAVVIRGWLYDLNILRSRRVDAKVVCIGNLTAGGTGKTPATILAALTLRRRDQPVAILSRGYGRPEKSSEVRVLQDGSGLDWRQCGDEPWMMHQLLKGQHVPILVAPDRVRSATQAVASFQPKVLLLDDGFQHRRLQRDLDVVLVDSLDPFGGGSLLPLGNLREPRRALRRAHLIMLTHVDQAPEAQLRTLREEIHRINPAAPLLESIHKPDFLLEVMTEVQVPFTRLQGRPVATLAGLAAPEQFEGSLEAHGIRIAQKWRYPDHHRYTHRELASIGHLRAGMPIVTTFKDLVRFPADWRELLAQEVYVLAIRLEIVRGKNTWNDALLGLAGGTPGQAAPAPRA